ncbi:VOC family protein [Streptomyces mesophilus]|uniref:VOC family protein n=1 Tax=Streptomyces mesophilus TaxID=1775132 RepID=UPI00331E047C
MPAPLTTGSAGLNVTDLTRSVSFYVSALGFEVVRRSPPGAPPWAHLGLDGQVLLTLWQQAGTPYAPARAGLHHLSFEVASMAELSALEDRVRAAAVQLREDPHGPARVSDRGQFFFRDPDGIRLELYTEEQPPQPAPAQTAPACGFYEELPHPSALATGV